MNIILRTIIIFLSTHFFIGVACVASIYLGVLEFAGNYPLDSILAWILVILLNIYLLKYFSSRITRVICAALILLAIYRCFSNDSHWRYAMTVVDDYQHNYTREWYCRLSDKDKSILESYTTHGIDDCTNSK